MDKTEMIFPNALCLMSVCTQLYPGAILEVCG